MELTFRLLFAQRLSVDVDSLSVLDAPTTHGTKRLLSSELEFSAKRQLTTAPANPGLGESATAAYSSIVILGDTVTLESRISFR
jgi:hypothetical protein